MIHVGWTLGGFGMGLAYSAHSQLTLRCAPAARYGTATASLQLFDNLGVALGAGVAGAVVTFGDDVGWDPGAAVAAALVPAAVVATVRRGRDPSTPAAHPSHDVTVNVAITWSSTSRSASNTSCITTTALNELSGGDNMLNSAQINSAGFESAGADWCATTVALVVEVPPVA